LKFHPYIQSTYEFDFSRKVVIDYLLYPKQHLIDVGFDNVWFGCEVKSPIGKREAHKKLLDFAKQSIDYTESDFDGTIPNFVVMFPGMSHFFGDEGDDDYQHAHYFCHLFRAFIQRFKVGTLSIDPKDKWHISFGSQRYFSKLQKSDDPIKSPEAALSQVILSD
jgi:hypothetical protein